MEIQTDEYIHAYFVDIPHTASSSIRRALGLLGTERHQPARLKRYDVGRDRWERAFTFAFVREPFERVAKMYLRRKRTRHNLKFQEWLEERFVKKEQPRDTTAGRLYWMPQTEFIADETGNRIVTMVGRFENLEVEWDVIRSLLGAERDLPHVNGFEYDEDWRYLYTKRCADIVRRHYSDDFTEFGYERDFVI